MFYEPFMVMSVDDFMRHSDGDDTIFKIVLKQQSRLKKYAITASVVGTYHNETYLNNHNGNIELLVGWFSR